MSFPLTSNETLTLRVQARTTDLDPEQPAAFPATPVWSLGDGGPSDVVLEAGSDAKAIRFVPGDTGGSKFVTVSSGELSSTVEVVITAIPAGKLVITADAPEPKA